MNPKFMNDMFENCTSNYDLRDSHLVQLKKFKTFEFSYRSFKYYGAKLWNSLPARLKLHTELFIFKRDLNEWCKSNEAASLEIF